MIWKHSFALTLCLLLAACGPVPDAAAPAETPTPDTRPTAQVDIVGTPSAIPATENATPDPLAALAPEIRDLFTAQNVAYELGGNGEMRVNLADTVSKESITIENITHTETNDGLAKNILTATNKEDGSRLVHVEGFGWIKDKEMNFTDPNTLTEVPENWPNRAINTLAALQNSENPRIPENAVDPHFYYTIGGWGGNMGYLSYESYTFDEEAAFTKETKPFAYSGFIKRGDQVIFVMTSKNPTPENKDQLINLLFGMDLNVYEEFLQKLPSGATRIENIILKNHNQLVAGILPPTEIDGVGIGYNPEAFVIYKGMTPNIGIARLPEQKDIMGLFDANDKVNIFEALKAGDPVSVRVSVLPKELSDYTLLTAVGDWGSAFLGPKY
ncbi:MAG: hypothetical protein ACOYY3_15565 [Chloroflexota bacterium]